MNRLSKEELIKTRGGFKITATVAGTIAGIITFGIGLVNGLLRPLSCSSSK